MRSRLHSAILVAPFAALALLAVLRVATTPDARGYGTHEQLGFGACRFRDWFDGPCPTCGVTTSASHLVHGDLALAWSTQPFGVLASIAAVVAAGYVTRTHLRGGDLAKSYLRHGRWFWGVLLAAIATCWLVSR